MTTIGPEQIADIQSRHVETIDREEISARRSLPAHLRKVYPATEKACRMCGECEQRWPCDAATLVAAYAELRLALAEKQ